MSLGKQKADAIVGCRLDIIDLEGCDGWSRLLQGGRFAAIPNPGYSGVLKFNAVVSRENRMLASLCLVSARPLLLRLRGGP